MRREVVACPKPRRLPFDHPVRPFRWPFVNQAEMNDLIAGTEVLDIILTKGGCGIEQQHSTEVASSPPFFCGSPPTRVANPLIKDERFREDNFAPFSQLSPASHPLSSSPRKGVCVRASFGNKPAVRVEGFDCLNVDSRNCRIPAWA